MNTGADLAEIRRQLTVPEDWEPDFTLLDLDDSFSNGKIKLLE
jgi:hypothetical protein